MPIDASIPLQVKTPEIASPLQTVGGLMQMRDMASQIALRNQQTQDVQAQAAQRQRDLKSWSDLQEKIRDPETQKRMAVNDYSDVYNTATPTVADTFIQSHQKMQTTAQALRKGDAEFYAGGRTLLATALEGLDLKDDTAAAQQMNSFKQNINADHPELAAQLPHFAPGPQFRSQLKDLAASNGIALAILQHQTELEGKQAETKKSQVETGTAARTQALQELTAVPPKDDATYQAWRAKFPDMNAPDTYDPDWAKTQARSAVPIEKQPEYDLATTRAKLGLMGNTEYDQFLLRYAQSLGKAPNTLTPEEGLASFQKFAEYKQDPILRQNAIEQKNIQLMMLHLQEKGIPTDEDVATSAKAIIDHRLAPEQFREIFGMMGGGAGSGSTRQRIMIAAQRMDPTFSWEKADSEYKAMEGTERSFTSGKNAELVRGNNVALEHLGILDQAREALKNGNVQVLNAIGNWVGVQVGKDPKTSFDAIAQRVAQEVNAAYIAGGGGEMERLQGGNQFASNMSDTQLSTNIRKTALLMDSQQRGLEDQYRRGTYGQGSQQLFTPGALASKSRLIGNPQQSGGSPSGTIKPGKGGIQYIKLNDGPDNDKNNWKQKEAK